MAKNPFKDTFEEYLAFHKSVVRKAKQTSSVKHSESSTSAPMSDEVFLKAHNLTEFDKFIEGMSDRYGI